MIKLNYKGVDIVALSDTHGEHREVEIPSCDVVVHAGDCCESGDEEQIGDFFAWLSELPAKHKIFVAGNHDLPFELFPESSSNYIPENVIFLNNSIIELEGVVFLGIEATMGLLGDIEIDEKVDILISHCAPYGIADEGGKGCKNLRKLIFDTSPAISIFGHFHSDSGSDQMIDGIRFLNVAIKQ